jgi:hypothetical protein
LNQQQEKSLTLSFNKDKIKVLRKINKIFKKDIFTKSLILNPFEKVSEIMYCCVFSF